MLFHPIFGKVLGEILEKWSKLKIPPAPFKKGGENCSMLFNGGSIEKMDS